MEAKLALGGVFNFATTDEVKDIVDASMDSLYDRLRPRQPIVTKGLTNRGTATIDGSGNASFVIEQDNAAAVWAVRRFTITAPVSGAFLSNVVLSTLMSGFLDSFQLTAAAPGSRREFDAGPVWMRRGDQFQGSVSGTLLAATANYTLWYDEIIGGE